jgi:hypothetical protein
MSCDSPGASPLCPIILSVTQRCNATMAKNVCEVRLATAHHHTRGQPPLARPLLTLPRCPPPGRPPAACTWSFSTSQSAQ